MRDRGKKLYNDQGGLGGQESTFADSSRLYENTAKGGWYTDPAALVEMSTTPIEEDAIHSDKSWSTIVWLSQYAIAMNSKPEEYEYAVCI